MKKFIALVMVFGLAIPGANAASISAGSPCSKLGATTKSGNAKLTCIKSGSKKVWSTSANSVSNLDETGKRICDGNDVYNYYLDVYNMFNAMRSTDSASQQEASEYRQMGIRIEESCNVQAFSPKIYPATSTCSSGVKNQLGEIKRVFSVLTTQYKDNLSTQTRLMQEMNNFQSTGRTQEATRARIQYESVIREVQYIYPGFDNLIGAFAGLNSTCKNSGVAAPVKPVA